MKFKALYKARTGTRRPSSPGSHLFLLAWLSRLCRSLPSPGVAVMNFLRARPPIRRNAASLGRGESAEELLLQTVARSARDVVDNVARSGGAGAIEKGVAKALAALADHRVHSILFVADRARGHQLQDRSALPMCVAARSVRERLGVGAAVEGGQVMCEPTVLQAGLVSGDEYPIRWRGGTKHGIRCRMGCPFSDWEPREIRLEMLGATMRRADVHEAAMDAAVGADVLAPSLFAGGQ